MAYARFIEHKGKKIILLDYKGIKNIPAALDAVAEGARFIGAQPHDKTTLTLTDVRDTVYDRSVVDAFKSMTKANAPIVKAAAVVTDSTLHRAAIGMIALVSRRKITAFDSREEAMDWLVKQA